MVWISSNCPTRDWSGVYVGTAVPSWRLLLDVGRATCGSSAALPEVKTPRTGDIPAISTTSVVREHYRGAFEAFCEEQAIKLTGEYRWIDPVMPTR
jgi:hypothetical protein